MGDPAQTVNMDCLLICMWVIGINTTFGNGSSTQSWWPLNSSGASSHQIGMQLTFWYQNRGRGTAINSSLNLSLLGLCCLRFLILLVPLLNYHTPFVCGTERKFGFFVVEYGEFILRAYYWATLFHKDYELTWVYNTLMLKLTSTLWWEIGDLQSTCVKCKFVFVFSCVGFSLFWWQIFLKCFVFNCKVVKKMLRTWRKSSTFKITNLEKKTLVLNHLDLI